MPTKCCMLNCEIEVDEQKMRQWYASAEEWSCECEYCSNFLKVAQNGQLPDEVLNLLSAFGIPPAKATYVCCLNSDKEKPLYQFSYRIAGRILKDDSSPILGKARFCHELYPYGAPDFPEPHFDIEFYYELPWIIGHLQQ